MNNISDNNDWTESCLSDIALINPRETIKKGSTSKSVAMEKLVPYCRKIDGFELKAFKGGTKFRNQDTLLARITPCLENGKTAYVDILEDGEIGFGSTEYIVIRPKEGLSDSKFLYYFSISPRFREEAIKLMTGTSGRQRVQTDQIVSKIFAFPKLPEQKAIAAILTSFDDKIELLRQQNQTLEEMAQTLFKEWFVDFRFPGVGKMIDSELGLIPEGWRVNGFLDLFNLLSGGTPKTSKEEYWNGKIKWVSAKDITPNHRKFILETEKSITQLGLKKSATKLLPEYTVVISARGTVGNYCLLSEPMCISQSNYGVRSKNDKLVFYTYLAVGNQIETLKSQAYGSVFDTITTSTFKGLSVICPPLDILISFEKIIDPLFKKIMHNFIQIQTLTQLRDSLLPKLMSGEVRVLT